jgi:hypothetical protein
MRTIRLCSNIRQVLFEQSGSEALKPAAMIELKKYRKADLATLQPLQMPVIETKVELTDRALPDLSYLPEWH